MSSEPNQAEEIYAPLAVPLSYYMMPVEEMPPDDQERARKSREIGLPLLRRARREAAEKKAAGEAARKAAKNIQS